MVIDGEIAALDERGVHHLDALSEAIAACRAASARRDRRASLVSELPGPFERRPHDLLDVTADSVIENAASQPLRPHESCLIPERLCCPCHNGLPQFRVGQDELDNLVLRAERWRDVLCTQLVVKLEHIGKRR
jgi:hypothetical protein